jgi:hypothetical protein
VEGWRRGRPKKRLADHERQDMKEMDVNDEVMWRMVGEDMLRQSQVNWDKSKKKK